MTSGLAEAWERYWHDLPTTPGAAPWDGDATAHVAEHVPLFEPYFERDLPLLDIGCGNGRQTLFLGTCFPRVIGLDVSESAVERARAGYVPDNVEFRRLDLLDTAAVADLSAELGDANVYMRAVLHQLPPESKLAAAANLARLLGERGHVFALELTPEAGDLLDSAAGEEEGIPKVKRVMGYGIVAAQWSDLNERRLLEAAGLRLLETGRVTLRTTDRLADGSPLDLPAEYAVATRA
ncbi:Methyltransferase domain-containing protein [Streptoalloteichus tenebrarius]|uniref:Methyltransferase domain-containing protein n=1 Tax=Streptoalloteichus tenebrarius (strain ATCC 17920 / DSM 40477 / JCM 4838 / CBS 697.72 / NBRC 16177 / NCIMB 11028 / NRRL B-12390 / A12253. 1 / ISP 5477) TaxID=1933 RepID=A0ABT1HSF5_STRSD|nr:class I SAM-dependent methyltransferase [Streptoalloteichus tenebrarius]MCP2258453.1 Methyltransferase domain-containing protein [Streptoalloteichus tenebrarius]